MKIEKNISNLLTVIICCFIVIGCQPKSQTITSEEPQADKLSQVNTDKENLLDLQSDQKIIPLENPKHGIINGASILIDVETENEDSVYQMIKDIPDEIDSLNSQAYRVQVFSSKSFGEAKHVKEVAEEIFDRPVFLDYEVPYYKIRVGNFSNREKAENYQQRVKSSGYKNAWVVAVIVNVKETSPLYDEILIPESFNSLPNDQDEKEPDSSE